MILEIFIALVALSTLLIIFGFYKPEWSFMPLVGFFFLFLLGMIIIAGGLEYKTGLQMNTTTYNSSYSSYTAHYSYETYNDSSTHYVGYFLTLASFFGFLGVIWNLRRWSSDN